MKRNKTITNLDIGKLGLSQSLCFDCAYGYADRCVKFSKPGVYYKGTVLDSGAVVSCPRYCPGQLRVADVANLLGVNVRAIYRMDATRVIHLLADKGWRSKS